MSSSRSFVFLGLALAAGAPVNSTAACPLTAATRVAVYADTTGGVGAASRNWEANFWAWCAAARIAPAMSSSSTSLKPCASCQLSASSASESPTKAPDDEVCVMSGTRLWGEETILKGAGRQA